MDLWMDVDAAIAEAPVNLMPLISDSDFKTIQASVAYNAAGLVLVWNFVTTAGAMSQTPVTPTQSAGNYDWGIQGNGLYSIEIPASGGASINNATAGFGWFSGVATGVLPWRGPVIGFRAAYINDALIDSATGLNAFADAVLKRDMSAVSGESARSPINALRLLRNKASVSAGTLTVTKEDDSTSAWTAAVTTTQGANPITAVDPA